MKNTVQRSAFATLALLFCCSVFAAVQDDGSVVDGRDVLAASALLAIDQNRATVVERIVNEWGDKLVVSGAGVSKSQLKEMLSAMRADQLLAASLAGSLDGLKSIVVAGAPGTGKARIADAGGIVPGALGDASADLVYTPVTPCRLFDTRTSQGGLGTPVTGVRRTYGAIAPVTNQGGVAGCAAAAGTAVALIQIGTLTPTGYGLLQAGPQGAASFPNALILYQPGDQYGATVAMPLNPANGQFDLVEQYGTADLYGDLLGYFRAARDIAISGNLTLVKSTASAGNVLKGTAPFIHNFGIDNTFIGQSAGNFTMSGSANTGIGYDTLASNTTGHGNAAIGEGALYTNTAGIDNSALGRGSLFYNTSGSYNTASGAEALRSNTTAEGNTANGYAALNANTIGINNTAIGREALRNNVAADQNTAVGWAAMFGNTTGDVNTAVGTHALFSNTGGQYNTAVGGGALYHATTGASNVAIGHDAGHNLTTGSFNITIGNLGTAADDHTTRIGQDQTRAFVAGIRGRTTGSSDAVPVLIDGFGQLGTINSSRRAKEDIADMDAASSSLMRLRPVTFHYRSDEGSSPRRLQYGLVAEEVEEVYPGLVAHTADGQVESVMYQFLAPMLLNEVQKQQRTIESQAREIAELRRAVEVLMARTSPDGKVAQTP